MIRNLIALLTLSLIVGTMQAEEPLQLGEKAPSFMKLPGVDGKKYSLSDFEDKDVLIVCFLANSCYSTTAYEARIVALNKKHKTGTKDSKVGFLAVCVSDHEDDTFTKMKERAKEKGYNFPYVKDASQEIGRRLDAVVTPQFFVFNKGRRLIYKGALDDNLFSNNAKLQYLETAVKVALQFPEFTPEAPARGCKIEYK